MKLRYSTRSIVLLTLCGCSYFATMAVAQQNAASSTNLATEPRIWTSADGKFKTHAELVTFVGDEVRLKKDDGKVVTVLIENLGVPDRGLVRGLRHGDFKNVIVGIVDTVSDGDTLVVADAAGEKSTVRLHGIDAPEDSQSGGKESCTLLRKKAEGKKVHIAWHEHDKYKRVLGQVFVGDTWINLAMLRDGGAWHYVEYSTDKQLAKAERDARIDRAGLWATDAPTPPWEYRHSSMPENSAPDLPAAGRAPLGLLGSGKVNAGVGTSGASPDSAAEPRGNKGTQAGKVSRVRGEIAEKNEEPAAPAQSTTVYVTKTGEKYHRAGCRYLKKSAIPIDLDSAKARYSPCSVCNPPS